MLRSLHIEHYILIDALDITFPEGLVIITGQTGAGKSILLGALSLLAGGRSDASLISEGADSCVVEALFDGSGEEIDALLREADVEEDGGRLLIRRVVSRSGRSRSFVNDCPVPLSLLQEVAGRLVDIHSQHKSLLLTDPRFQLSVLDHFAGNSALLGECRTAWRALQGCRTQLSRAREERDRLLADRDYNEAQWRQLEEAALVSGEIEALEEEERSLSNAGQIRESLARALDPFAPAGDGPGLSASLKDAARQLEHISRYLGAASSLGERLESVRIELDDIEGELEDLFRRIDVRIARLEAEEQGCAARYASACSALRVSRLAAAPRFAESITGSLRYLELDRAVFSVSLVAAPEGETGADRVAFLFSATGGTPAEVSKCASGGELSRIMLCLKEMMARYVGMPTLIFDEIDAGVSGSVADKMGRLICAMGRDMQVFSITHLPQVAAKGEAHFVVSKQTGPDGRTRSGIHPVTGEERTMEIARLLSGETITPEAVQNARVLLSGK